MKIQPNDNMGQTIDNLQIRPFVLSHTSVRFESHVRSFLGTGILQATGISPIHITIATATISLIVAAAIVLLYLYAVVASATGFIQPGQCSSS